MLGRWITITFACVTLLLANLAIGEEQGTSDLPSVSSPERVQIISISGKPLVNHPSVINVLPGEQISFGADVLQFANACFNPQGCKESRAAEEFTWSADDRSENECNARHPQPCRDRTAFQPDGNEIIFHIPYSMPRNITIRLSHESISSQDSIVLHNAHYADSPRASFNEPYSEDYYPRYLNPTFAPSGINQPYWGPYYYPYAYGWGPYPYYPRWAWWGWGGPGWTIGFGWGVGPGWGWPYRGWYAGYYHPGFYGYHPGWWRSGYVVASRPVGPRMSAGRLPTRPMGYAEPRGGGYGMPRGYGRRWR